MRHILYIAFLICGITFALISCTTDPETINRVTKHEKIAMYEAHNVRILYSDSAQILFSMKTVYVRDFAKNDTPYTEYPKGIEVVHYSKYPNDTSAKLTANYAIRWPARKVWEAKSKVVCMNVKKEVLHTEYLVWDEAKQKIYTDKFVKITTPTDVITGDGMEANQDFTNWRIKKVRGMISVKQNTSANDSTK